MLLAARCSLASAQFTASTSVSICCHHPAICCGVSSGCGCGSWSGWACPRRCSSAAGFPGYVPGGVGVGGPLLVPGVGGFEALAFGGQLGGEGWWRWPRR